MDGLDVTWETAAGGIACVRGRVLSRRNQCREALWKRRPETRRVPHIGVEG